MLKTIQKYKTKKEKKYGGDIYCRRLCDDNRKTKPKINRTIQVQLQSLSSPPLTSVTEVLNNIQQNVCNCHLIMTHGEVGIHGVVLKFSYIIWHGSDIITEYVIAIY